MSDEALPLPVARLRRRSHNAKSGRDRHDNAHHAFELSVRLGVIAHGVPAPSRFRQASLGHWVAALEGMDRRLTDPAILELFAWLSRSRSERQSVHARELLGSLAEYRNAEVGHGSVRDDPGFYAEAAQILVRGLEACWAVDLFFPPGSLLVWVESIEVTPDGSLRARVFDLSGESPVVLDPTGTDVGEAIRPRRLYLRVAADWRPLHPWAAFDPVAERVFLFNGARRSVRFLDFASGEERIGQAVDELSPGAAEALRALLGHREAHEAVDKEPDVPSGEHTIGAFTLRGKLGHGAMGTVYLAVQELEEQVGNQRPLRRLVALKVLDVPADPDSVALQRFRREVQALSLCEHPNVVKIFTSGADGGIPYYSMELVVGSDLARVARTLAKSASFDEAVSSAVAELRAERSNVFEQLPVVERRPSRSLRGDRSRDLARFFRDAARGVQHLHDHGIIHRDLSPANIMVTEDGERAVIMDLGLAAVEDASVRLTADRPGFLGTLRYVPPEQLQRHLLRVDHRADVYALGATLYELLAGRPPLDGETEERLIHQILREDPPRLDRLAPDVPPDLAAIVHKALEKDPERRYPSARDLALDLDAFLEGRPVGARPQTTSYVVARWCRRNAALATTCALLLVVVLASGFALAWVEGRSRREAQRALDERRAGELVESADHLGPVHPDSVPAMQAWLEDAELVVARKPEWEHELEELRREGRSSVPTTVPDEESEKLREWRDLIRAQVESDRAALKAGGLSGAGLQLARESVAIRPAEAARLSLLLEEREERSARDDGWRFDDPALAQRYDVVVGFVNALRGLAHPRWGKIEVVKERLRRARSVEGDSVGAFARYWVEARRAIRASPRYGDFDLAPQLGLVPLGANASGFWEFWHVLSGDRPLPASTGGWVVASETGCVLVLIPGGTFRMGAPRNAEDRPSYDPDASDTETPHDVTLDPYFISKYEMTRGQWIRATGDDPSYPRLGESLAPYTDGPKSPMISLTHPVNQISWRDALIALARWGLGLPTESQWERAARGGSGAPFPWGRQGADEVLCRHANSRLGFPGTAVDDGYFASASVEAFPPNTYGLHQVAGNHREWCFDWYSGSAYQDVEPQHGTGLRVPKLASTKVHRGGSMKSNAPELRVSARASEPQDQRSREIGVRPARALDAIDETTRGR